VIYIIMYDNLKNSPVTLDRPYRHRPDGYVMWVGDPTQPNPVEALTTWFGPAASV